MMHSSKLAAKMVKVAKLTYPSKLWFVYVCGLPGVGLVPGRTLLEEHVTKKECKDMFGGMVRGHNGYRTRKHLEFDDRMSWL